MNGTSFCTIISANCSFLLFVPNSSFLIDWIELAKLGPKLWDFTDNFNIPLLALPGLVGNLLVLQQPNINPYTCGSLSRPIFY
jgi:hypothetical protein